jgi:hypothetical protein
MMTLTSHWGQTSHVSSRSDETPEVDVTRWPYNTRIERPIGAGILVKERRKMAPLAAHPACYMELESYTGDNGFL